MAGEADIMLQHLTQGSRIVITETPKRISKKLTLYRDDSTAQVVFENVKTWFWTANNTVLVISLYDGDEGTSHHYVHWPRERFCWFKAQSA